MDDTYEAAHVGDVVRGFDGNDWRVVDKGTDPRLGMFVTLAKVSDPACRVTGYPPADTRVTFVARGDHSAEHAAAGALIAAFGSVDLIREWES